MHGFCLLFVWTVDSFFYCTIFWVSIRFFFLLALAGQQCPNCKHTAWEIFFLLLLFNIKRKTFSFWSLFHSMKILFWAYFFCKIVIPSFLSSIFLTQICFHKILLSCMIVIVRNSTVLKPNKTLIYMFSCLKRLEVSIIHHWITNKSLHCIKWTEVII